MHSNAIIIHSIYEKFAHRDMPPVIGFLSALFETNEDEQSGIGEDHHECIKFVSSVLWVFDIRNVNG